MKRSKSVTRRTAAPATKADKVKQLAEMRAALERGDQLIAQAEKYNKGRYLEQARIAERLAKQAVRSALGWEQYQKRLESLS